MNINGIDFTPQEVEAIAIALDRMEELQEEAAEIAKENEDSEHAAVCENEAAVARSARDKWSQVRRTRTDDIKRDDNVLAKFLNE